eukprot:scaffold3640_cov168-Ochromonas_danica.AAC.3
MIEGLDEDDDNDNNNNTNTTNTTTTNTAHNDDNNGSGSGGNNTTTTISQIKEALSKSVGKSSLKQGWLKKKRGGLMWQRRWDVLFHV